MWSPRSLIAWFWTLVVFGLCWTPRALLPINETPPVPLLYGYFDKLVHFFMFAGFGFFWMFARAGKARWIIAIGVAAATISELGQAIPIINRDAEWSDGMADVLGVLAGVGVSRFGWAMFPPLPKPTDPVDS